MLDRMSTQDEDGVWRQAIPLPFECLRWTLLGPRFGYRCMQCGVKFRSEQAYRGHYRSDHAESVTPEAGS